MDPNDICGNPESEDMLQNTASSNIFGFTESSLDDYFHNNRNYADESSQKAVNYLGNSANAQTLMPNEHVLQLQAACQSYDVDAGFANEAAAVAGYQATSGYNEIDTVLTEMGISASDATGTVNAFTDIGVHHSQVSSEFAGLDSQDLTDYNFEQTNCAFPFPDNFQTTAEVELAIKQTSSTASDDLAQESSATAEAPQDTDNQAAGLSENNPLPTSAPATATESSAPPASPRQPTQPNQNQHDEAAMSSQVVKTERATGQKSGDDNEIVLNFASTEQANEYPKRNHVPHDPTLPKTTEEKKAIVKEMIKAMRDCENTEDNQHMVKPFRDRKHPVLRLEIVCWNLLDACMTRHLNGPLLLGYDVKHGKTTSTISSFQERKEAIVSCLRTHKTICKHLLDPFYLYNFVDDPQGARQRVRSNKTLNKKKTEVMNAGKQALGKDTTPKPTDAAKKEGSKSARTSEEVDIPSPFPTPGNASDTAAQPATPALNLNACPPAGYISPNQPDNTATMTPAASSPLQDMSSSMSGSEESSMLNSPTQNQSFSYNMMENMGSLNTFPGNIQVGGNSMPHFPTVTYPTGRTTQFSPVNPSGLQNVYQNAPMMDPQYGFSVSTVAPQQMNIQPYSFPPAPQQDTRQQPSELSASRTPFGRGSKRPRTDEESDGSGSPQKKPRY